VIFNALTGYQYNNSINEYGHENWWSFAQE
jgi:hypothetical protein